MNYGIETKKKQENGKTLLLYGPRGIGKSTVMRCIKDKYEQVFKFLDLEADVIDPNVYFSFADVSLSKLGEKWLCKHKNISLPYGFEDMRNVLNVLLIMPQDLYEKRRSQRDDLAGLNPDNLSTWKEQCDYMLKVDASPPPSEIADKLVRMFLNFSKFLEQELN